MKRHISALLALLLMACTNGEVKTSTPLDEAPEGMTLIPGGSFRMGTDSSTIPGLMQRFGTQRAEFFLPEIPGRSASIEPFYLDKTEVTNGQYADFVSAMPEWAPDSIAVSFHNGRYLEHWSDGTYENALTDHPVVFVPWYAAVAYCVWRGKRLPTEAEWEYAARGGLEDSQFPWGEEPPDSTRVNWAYSRLGGPVSVGRYTPNAFGLYDMAGNVWEYVVDGWTSSYSAVSGVGAVTSGFDPDTLHRVRTRRVIRGGSWGAAAVNLRVAFRDSHPPDGAGDHVGFRCAKSLSGRADR